MTDWWAFGLYVVFVGGVFAAGYGMDKLEKWVVDKKMTTEEKG